MDALEAIYTRKSVRKFEDKEVPEELVRKILKAGMSAPSAGNAQPWQFIIISERNALAEIPGVSPYAECVAKAPLAILVCGDKKLEKHKDYWVQDCSAASQNMLLAAHALGLGAVWTGAYPMETTMEGFRVLLKIPEHIVPFSLIVIGYPAEGMHKEKYIGERIHYDKW
ncbi:MAG: nitroreductase family protein [Candidatus Micrarchaeota archaeon]